MNIRKYAMASGIGILILSGCTSNSQMVQLQNRTYQQAMIIQNQQKTIEKLNRQLRYMKKSKARIQARSAAQSAQTYAKPKQNIKLKKVEDTNYNDSYMYPGAVKTKKETPATPVTSNTSSMNKESCISMIGEEKFIRYTQLFGSEAAAIKRCNMLKAMQH